MTCGIRKTDGGPPVTGRQGRRIWKKERRMKMRATGVILKYMEDNGITYREVAARTGRSAQNIWNTLNGKDGNRPEGTKGRRDPNYKTIVEICDALSLKITIRPTGGGHDPDTLVRAAELGPIPFSVVQKILEAGGYSIAIEIPEEK